MRFKTDGKYLTFQVATSKPAVLEVFARADYSVLGCLFPENYESLWVTASCTFTFSIDYEYFKGGGAEQQHPGGSYGKTTPLTDVFFKQ